MAFIGDSHTHGTKPGVTNWYGLFIPPPSHVLGLDSDDSFVFPKGGEGGGDVQVCLFTLRQWASLAVRGDFFALHFLFEPLEFTSEIWNVFASRRQIFLAKKHATSYFEFDDDPHVNNAWYANADRTIWATFWGWDFVRRGSDEPDSKTGYEPGQKVLWYKPTDYALTVTGRRIDGAAPPLVYDIAREPRPRGPIQPSRVYFPAPGCWEINAKAGSSELRFVVLVKSPGR